MAYDIYGVDALAKINDFVSIVTSLIEDALRATGQLSQEDINVIKGHASVKNVILRKSRGQPA